MRSVIRVEASLQQEPLVLGLVPIIYSHFFPSWALSPLQTWCIISSPALTPRLIQCIHAWCMYTVDCTGHPCLRNGCYWQPHRAQWTHAHRFSAAGTKRASEVLRERDRQEERRFLHHQDSRINLNRRTLQHCPANSTNGLFQRRHTRTHTRRYTAQIRDEFLWASPH